MTRTPIEPRCVRCGCTPSRACPQTLGDGRMGCSWVLLDRRRRAGLCTACATSLELVFAHLPALDDAEDHGVDAETLAGFLLLPTSTVRKCLASLEERGLATPVEKIGNTMYWCAPAVDVEEQELDAQLLALFAPASITPIETIEALEQLASKDAHTYVPSKLLADLVAEVRAWRESAEPRIQAPAESAMQLRDADDWVIWSFEHDGWWAPHERGYVKRLEYAGRYTEQRALEIETNANRHLRPGEQHEAAMRLDTARTFNPEAGRVGNP